VKSVKVIYKRLLSLHLSEGFWALSRNKRYRLIGGLMKEMQ
jgi:hypothetical protein